MKMVITKLFHHMCKDSVSGSRLGAIQSVESSSTIDDQAAQGETLTQRRNLKKRMRMQMQKRKKIHITTNLPQGRPPTNDSDSRLPTFFKQYERTEKYLSRIRPRRDDNSQIRTIGIVRKVDNEAAYNHTNVVTVK